MECSFMATRAAGRATGISNSRPISATEIFTGVAVSSAQRWASTKRRALSGSTSGAAPGAMRSVSMNSTLVGPTWSRTTVPRCPWWRPWLDQVLRCRFGRFGHEISRSLGHEVDVARRPVRRRQAERHRQPPDQCDRESQCAATMPAARTRSATLPVSTRMTALPDTDELGRWGPVAEDLAAAGAVPGQIEGNHDRVGQGPV
jgi:hypothetical protein